MRKMVIAVVLGVMVLHCGVAHAAQTWDDMSWWGNTGAKPEPKADSKERTGCWWLPKAAAKNENDAELWGNRGILFHAWKKPVVQTKTTAPPPPLRPLPHPDGHVLLNNILFDLGKTALKPEAKVELDKLVVMLKKWPRDTVVVEGHTSSDGDAAYNMALGQRRADTAKKYMVESGIAPERIKTISYGHMRPAVPNDSEPNRKLNRRAEFQYNPVN